MQYGPIKQSPFSNHQGGYIRCSVPPILDQQPEPPTVRSSTVHLGHLPPGHMRHPPPPPRCAPIPSHATCTIQTRERTFRDSVPYLENCFYGLKPPGLGQPEPRLSHLLPDGCVSLKQLDSREPPLGPDQAPISESSGVAG